MTAKFKHIIEKLGALVTFKADKEMTDDDFIANIDAFNLLCNTYDDLGLDRKAMHRKMNSLYPEFLRRIYGKKDIQYAVSLIKSLNDFIYGRAEDCSPKDWRNTLTEMCCKVVDSYLKNPLIDTVDYLFALDTVCRINDEPENQDIQEYKSRIDRLLEGIDSTSTDEKIRRVKAYELSKHLFVSDNWEKWAEIREQLKYKNVRQKDDKTFLSWCDMTDQYPVKDLKKRSGNSLQLMVAYVRSQIIFEFEKQSRLTAKRQLARDLKTLNDEIIGDIIPLKIDEKMSVSTLYAIETLFYLRLQLAQVGWDDKEPIYNALCRDRFEKISKVLRKKYALASSLNEKIEILERLSAIGSMICSPNYDFAIEEAAILKETSGLTYAQQLRLDWIPTITSENESQIVAKLLPGANTSFEIGTLALITDYISGKEREDVLNRYFELFDTAIAAGNASEVGKLLTLAAYWNSDPIIRPRLTEATNRVRSVEGISLPKQRINLIATEIYQQIAAMNGGLEDIA